MCTWMSLLGLLPLSIRDVRGRLPLEDELRAGRAPHARQEGPRVRVSLGVRE